MPKIRHFLTGFFGGEVTPLMGARVDTDQYRYGLETCENWVAVNEGPLIKRPGFEYIRDAASTSTWLSKFRFSITQEYAIEWLEHKARFFTNGGRIETAPNVAYEVAVPYGAADAPALSVQQNFDRLYIDHPNYPPAALRRDSATTFTHEVTQLLNGPFLDGNIVETDQLTVTGTLTVGGAVTIVGPGGFTADHVGALMRIECEDFSDIPAWEPGIDGVLEGDVRRSDGKAYTSLTPNTSGDDSKRTGSIQPTHTKGAEYDGMVTGNDANDKDAGGILWQYTHDRFGIVQITAFTDATHVSAVVKRRLPSTSSPFSTWRWAHGAFSKAAGYPSLVALAWGRLNHIKEFDLIGSVTGDFGGGRTNFATFTDSGALAADLGFRRRLSGEDPPLWVAVDQSGLLAGSATREIKIGPLNSQQAISGENINAEPQSYYGSEALPPIQVGTETIFVERGGRRIRSADYDFARDRYDAPDLTAAARHITAGGVVQLAHQRVPYPLLYGVRGDGQLIVHSNTRLEIKGFSRIALGGSARALSAVSIVGEDGKTDELWLLVQRTVPSGTRREIWKQAAWRELGDDQKQAFFVDGGVAAIQSANDNTLSGLTHLAGQPVAVLCNGGVVPGLTVSGGGVLTIPAEYVPAYQHTVVVGLAYTATAVALRPWAQIAGQFVTGLLQRAVKVVFSLLETFGLKVGVPGGTLEEVTERPTETPMNEPAPLYSGYSEGLVEAEFDRNGRVRWISETPLPAVVLGTIMNLDVDQVDA